MRVGVLQLIVSVAVPRLQVYICHDHIKDFRLLLEIQIENVTMAITGLRQMFTLDTLREICHGILLIDKLFKEIRDLNFEVVVQVLRQKATSMKQDYTEMTTTTQTVSELKDFVKKLNSLPEITRHINLAQHLSAFTSKPSFLGRLDMEHTIVEAQSYDMRELLHSYGFEHMATLNNLEKAGLLKKQETKSNWLTIKRALQLVVEDTDTTNPNDIAYVFSGYAPLSIRLVQQAVRSGWRPIEEILKLLPGPHSETKRSGFASSQSIDNLAGAPASIDKVTDGRRSLVLVVFIGGLDSSWVYIYIEVLAFQQIKNFLTIENGEVGRVGVVVEGGEGMAYDLIVGTTKIVGGHSLTETFIESLG
ncbi:Vacuolar protein-sorting-associated protein 33-like [Vitis vinifera]|uniref:Vacuolar protein-sorting-associated protein 33-like n=1 Tax=Vitis vinifera TaxID=29760 RepID=A0A438DUD4_VITVI|nr:Vacuolar protein-sorting-associated protein 33-like [Vitis vinifera]